MAMTPANHCSHTVMNPTRSPNASRRPRVDAAGAGPPGGQLRRHQRRRHEQEHDGDGVEEQRREAVLGQRRRPAQAGDVGHAEHGQRKDAERAAGRLLRPLHGGLPYPSCGRPSHWWRSWSPRPARRPTPRPAAARRSSAHWSRPACGSAPRTMRRAASTVSSPPASWRWPSGAATPTPPAGSWWRRSRTRTTADRIIAALLAVHRPRYADGVWTMGTTTVALSGVPDDEVVERVGRAMDALGANG